MKPTDSPPGPPRPLARPYALLSVLLGGLCAACGFAAIGITLHGHRPGAGLWLPALHYGGFGLAAGLLCGLADWWTCRALARGDTADARAAAPTDAPVRSTWQGAAATANGAATQAGSVAPARDAASPASCT